MKRFTHLVLLLALPTVGAAQQLDPAAAWEDFLATNGPGWTAEWNPATGTPSAIFGDGLKVAARLETLAEARAQANAVIEKHSVLLGRGRSTFVETSAARIRHLFYFIYRQRFRGLEVIDARADVRINERGVVAMFGASTVRIPAGFAVKPRINAWSARAIAAEKVLDEPGQKRLPAPPRLVIWADVRSVRKTTPVLAWEVQIDERPAKLIVGKAYIDASRGKMLEFRNEVFECSGCGKSHVSSSATTKSRPVTRPAKSLAPLTGTVMAWTNIGLHPIGPLTNIPLANLRVTSSAGSAFTDSKGRFSIPFNGGGKVTVNATLEGLHCRRVRVQTGTMMTASAAITAGQAGGIIQFGTKNMGEQNRSQTTMYHFVDDVWSWANALVPNKPAELSRLKGINPRVNINASCNATYSRLTINHYNKSTTCNMTAFQTVIYHEWGHGFDDMFGGINRADGLSEGWADTVAILRSKQPHVAIGFHLTRVPSYIRTALNTRTYPVVGTTHAKGEVWMGWVWDTRTDLVRRFGATLGHQFTEQIVIPTIAANSGSLAQQVREVFLLDDKDGNLNNGTPNYISLEKASIKRKIAFPRVNPGSLTHTPLKATNQQLTPRVVRVLADPNKARFNKVELVYDIGAGTKRREMVPTGKPFEHIALLPGVSSPTNIRYHIEAEHVTLKVLRSPQFGEIGYSIGRETVFWSDDFETARPGWQTNPLIGTRNDFVRSRPAGATGTIWGVPWNDPAGAFSGSRSWGNNATGSHAAYYAAYLRSPKIDLTGKRNVRLRFMRWLQIQEGKYDQANLLFNGKKIWSNPWDDHTRDRAWTNFDVRLPAADNNPSVQFEWQIIADGGMELAGWNIDDVTLYRFDAIPPPKMQFRFDPAQVELGKQSEFTIQGTANAPVVILASASPGPITIPGIPTLHVGGNFIAIPAGLDAKGQLKFKFKAPTVGSATGQLTYCHALEMSGATLGASNPQIVLWGK